MSDSRRSKGVSGNPAKAAAASSTKGAPAGAGPEAGAGTSIARTALAALVALAGVAWIGVYKLVADESKSLPWMTDLGRWNFLIGFSLLFIGLAMFANKATPLGRGRGVVVGMLGCFLLGLVWIVVYYMSGGNDAIPLIRDLDTYNLIVGIGFMAVGFVYATHWE